MDIKKITKALETALEEVRKEDLSATIEIKNQSSVPLSLYLSKQDDKYVLMVKDGGCNDDIDGYVYEGTYRPGDTLNIKFTLNAIPQKEI